MSLLLCRRRAGTPFCHDKLNINIWSEQELSFIIYNYPLVCLDGFCGEKLYGWIAAELKLGDLAEKLKIQEKRGERPENQLVLILQECNYYSSRETASFRQTMSEIARYTEDERLAAEGRALFRAGNYNTAFERFSSAVKVLEQGLRRDLSNDDARLREHNKKKAGLYCDMAAAKFQLFDEKAAVEMLALSDSIYANERAKSMRYLADGSGGLSEDKKALLDKKKEDVAAAVREGAAYKAVRAIFEKDEAAVFKEARKLAAVWKQQYRKM